MSNPAQEEVDRLFNSKSRPTSHPEDQDSDSEAHTEEENSHRRTIRSSRYPNAEEQDTDDEDEDEDEDTAANMGTMTTTTNSYTVPSTIHHANTGPKGVIADAQSYHRARRSTFRRTLTSISDTLSFAPKFNKQARASDRTRKTNAETSSGSENDLDDEDSEFMQQWRERRLAELQEQFSTSASQGQNHHPSRRTFGTLDDVNAAGYLDAIEMTPRETCVVVFLFDPHSKDSREVEDELSTMAYRWSHVRFVKLHHEIAEMETMEIPAILAYRGGDVFATISGAEREGLESALRDQGVLNR